MSLCATGRAAPRGRTDGHDNPHVGGVVEDARASRFRVGLPTVNGRSQPMAASAFRCRRHSHRCAAGRNRAGSRIAGRLVTFAGLPAWAHAGQEVISQTVRKERLRNCNIAGAWWEIMDSAGGALSL